MNKNVLIISTSLRVGRNSETLAEAFAVGAKEANHQVEVVSLVNKKINFCIGCLSCQSTKECVIKDDSNEIVAKMKKADVIVFATPVYYYEMCGQMKTLLDRSNPLFSTDYSFRDIYLIATAADADDSAMVGVTAGLQGWIDCYEKTSLKGVIKGLDADAYDDIKKHPAYREAYEMGKNV